jgi:hypothetical protein
MCYRHSEYSDWNNKRGCRRASDGTAHLSQWRRHPERRSDRSVSWFSFTAHGENLTKQPNGEQSCRRLGHPSRSQHYSVLASTARLLCSARNHADPANNSHHLKPMLITTNAGIR